jgi:lysophospholipase L1-like esterase
LESSSPDPSRIPTSAEGSRWVPLLAWSYLAFALFIWIGFALHRGAEPVIGPYTPGYLAFLLILAIALVVPPGTLLLLDRVLGGRRAIRMMGSLVLLGLLGYGLVEVAHASSRVHSFDPFLQFPGTRFDSVPQRAEAGVTRVVTLGGSTTHNPHLAPEDRYPAVMEALLNRSGRYEVLNAGMDWWTTKHSHINYVTYVRRWEPEVVVVMHAINDLYRSFHAPRFSVGEYDPQWSHFYGPAIQGVRPRSLLGRALNSWNAWEFNRRWYSAWRFVEEERAIADYRSLPDFEISLRSLVRTLKGDGVRVILVTQPSLYKSEMSRAESARIWFPATFCVTIRNPWVRGIPSTGSMAAAMDAYNGVVLRVAEEEGVEAVDAASVIPRSLDYFGDDVHYTEQGAAALAESVARALLVGGP